MYFNQGASNEIGSLLCHDFKLFQRLVIGSDAMVREGKREREPRFRHEGGGLSAGDRPLAGSICHADNGNEG